MINAVHCVVIPRAQVLVLLFRCPFLDVLLIQLSTCWREICFFLRLHQAMFHVRFALSRLHATAASRNDHKYCMQGTYFVKSAWKAATAHTIL